MKKEIVVNNLLVSFEEVIGKSEKTLLFLHGWRSDKEAWGGILLSLKNENVNMFALDLPGFGKSQIPINPHPETERGLGVGDYANVVAEFIRKLNLNNVIVVGHSFGGRVGIKLASLYPEIISKLVLVDSAGFASSENKRSFFGLLAMIVKPFFKPKFMQGLRKWIYKKIGSEDYLATPELQKTYINVIGEDLSLDMKKVSCPTLIITGENDTDTPIEFGHKMNSLIKNSKFIILKDAGHFSFLDQNEKFVKILAEFI